MTFSAGLTKIAKKLTPPSKLKELLALTGGVTVGIKTLPKEE